MTLLKLKNRLDDDDIRERERERERENTKGFSKRNKKKREK